MIVVDIPMPKLPEPAPGVHRHMQVAKNWWAIEYVGNVVGRRPDAGRFFVVDLGIVPWSGGLSFTPKYGVCGPRGGVRFKNAAQAKHWCMQLDEHMARVHADAAVAENRGAA